jgi:hypothetical protein
MIFNSKFFLSVNFSTSIDRFPSDTCLRYANYISLCSPLWCWYITISPQLTSFFFLSLPFSLSLSQEGFEAEDDDDDDDDDAQPEAEASEEEEE